MGWEIFPEGLTDLLVSYSREYRLPPIYVTENGAAMPDSAENGEIKDPGRTQYLQRHLDALGAAMEQGVDVAGRNNFV